MVITNNTTITAMYPNNKTLDIYGSCYVSFLLHLTQYNQYTYYVSSVQLKTLDVLKKIIKKDI